MTEPSTRTRTLCELASLLCFAAAVAAALTTAVIFESMRSGRLSSYPRVDDVIYMARGARLYVAAHTDGIGSLVRDYAADPPHSPYASGVAALGYSLLGVVDWAPYAVAGMMVGVFLTGVAWITRREPVWVRLGAILLAVCTPLLSASVHNLKADYACGMLTALAATALVLRARTPRTLARLGAGVFFGLALLAKPTAFPLTLAMLALSAACVSGIDARGRPVRRPVRTIGLGFLPVAAGAAVVSGWHFVLAGGRTGRYVAEVLWGDQHDQWTYHASIIDHLLYYLTGPGGRLMLGRELIPLGTLIALSAILVLLRRRTAELVLAGKLALLLLAAYAVPTISPTKIAQFGATSQALAVLVASVGVVFLCRAARRASAAAVRRTLYTGVIISCLLAPLLFQWTFPRMRPDGGAARRAVRDDRTIAVRRIVDAALNAAPEKGSVIAILAGPGEVNSDLLTLESIRRGMSVRIVQMYAPQPREQFDLLLSTADVIVANDGETGLTLAKRAVPGADAEMLAAVRSQGGLVEVGTVVLESAGGRFHVLVQAGRIPPTSPRPR